jgi:hypothetical protein
MSWNAIDWIRNLTHATQSLAFRVRLRRLFDFNQKFQDEFGKRLSTLGSSTRLLRRLTLIPLSRFRPSLSASEHVMHVIAPVQQAVMHDVP